MSVNQTVQQAGGSSGSGHSTHNPYTYISSQGRFRDTADDTAQESVDLLQMVPEARGSRVSDTSTMQRSGAATLPSSKVHCTNSPRRMRMVLLPSDTEGEEDSTNPLFHTCGHSCSRDSSIYYSRVNSGPTSTLGTTTPNTASCLQDNQSNEREDGSAYFDYLQFNKRSVSNAYGSHPSLYMHHKHVNCAEASKEYFKCCKKNTNTLRSTNSTSKLYSQFSKSFKRKHDAGSRTESDLDSAFSVAAQNKLKKHKEWTRIKRLMFLVGILIGIVVALGGLVIGFLVLTPKQTGECNCSFILSWSPLYLCCTVTNFCAHHRKL